MSKLLERAVDEAPDRLVLLAPEGRVPQSFGRVETDPGRRTQLLHEMQRMRGRVYAADGAVPVEALTADGRHQTPQDTRGWHTLALDADGQVTGCAWFLEHAAGVDVRDLRVRHTPLARMVRSRALLYGAIASEITRARRAGLGFVEVGGWAVSHVGQIATDGLLLALAGYGLGRLQGGVLGVTTATVRHCSSTILRRIGGKSLENRGTLVPSYFDPRYRCEMELLGFDSRMPNPRYERLIERLTDRLTNVLVLTDSDPVSVQEVRRPVWQGVLGFGDSPAVAAAS